MTPPKTNHLPLISAGLIWDGETEYQNARPPGISEVFLLRMYGDKTRRFSERLSVAEPMKRLIRAKAAGWEQIGITFVNPWQHIDTGFLAYDGALTHDAVNQFFKLLRYREHAARFAHQLDASHGFESTQSATEEDRLITHQVLSDMIGVAWKRYKEWEVVDSETIIQGGEYDGTLLWKRNEQLYDDTDAELCGQCNVSTFGRRFRRKADLPLFRQGYRQGTVHSADRTVTPWATKDFALLPGPAPYGAAYEELKDEFDAAKDYYDEVVGPKDEA